MKQREHEIVGDMLEALILARRWLANCMPIVDLDGPKPLPVVEKAIRRAAELMKGAQEP